MNLKPIFDEHNFKRGVNLPNLLAFISGIVNAPLMNYRFEFNEKNVLNDCVLNNESHCYYTLNYFVNSVNSG